MEWWSSGVLEIPILQRANTPSVVCVLWPQTAPFWGFESRYVVSYIYLGLCANNLLFAGYHRSLRSA
jgi:hypothetical protein